MRRSTTIVAVLASTVLLGAAAVAAEWRVGRDAAPVLTGGGWDSDVLAFVDVPDGGVRGTVLVCRPGELRAAVVVTPGAEARVGIDVVEVRVPYLDDTAGRRVATGVVHRSEREAAERLDDVLLAAGEPESLLLELVWDVEECPESTDAYLAVEQLELTYRALGRAHRRQLDLVVPLLVTSRTADEVARELDGVVRGA